MRAEARPAREPLWAVTLLGIVIGGLLVSLVLGSTLWDLRTGRPLPTNVPYAIFAPATPPVGPTVIYVPFLVTATNTPRPTPGPTWTPRATYPPTATPTMTPVATMGTG